MLYIALAECVIYLAHIMYPKAPGAVILLAEGKPVNWLRYAGWLVTTPILIIHMPQACPPTFHRGGWRLRNRPRHRGCSLPWVIRAWMVLQQRFHWRRPLRRRPRPIWTRRTSWRPFNQSTRMEVGRSTAPR